MQNEQKEADTQREAESRDCLSVPSEMGKQLQILTSQHLLQPQRNLPVLPTTGSWDLGCTEGAKALTALQGVQRGGWFCEQVCGLGDCC